MQIIRRSDWGIHPLPEKHETIALEGSFTEQQMQRIKAGFRPRTMDDFWFIYWEEDTLFFHRSWTGFCIYEVKFVREGECYKMIKADINRDPEQYGETNGERDKKTITCLIDSYFFRYNPDYLCDNET